MAIISFVMEDREDGTVATKFVSNQPLPEDVERFTSAQQFAHELRLELERIGMNSN